MSVVVRSMQGRTYIHVRRKVNKVQKQKFYAIDGLSDKEIALLKHKAAKLDKEWSDEQGNDSAIALLFDKGQPAHIRIVPPSLRSGWSVSITKHETDTCAPIFCSRSIDKHGFESAFNLVFNRLIKGVGLKPKSTTAQVSRSLFYSYLAERYKEMHFYTQKT